MFLKLSIKGSRKPVTEFTVPWWGQENTIYYLVHKETHYEWNHNMCEKTRIDFIPTHFLMKVEYLLFIENKFWFFALLFSIFKYLVAGTSNNGWENSPGSIISCESSFAHAGAIVNNESSSIFVTHFDKFLFFSSVFKSYETLITTREDCRMTKS